MRLVAVDHPRPGQRLKCLKCQTMQPAQDMLADLGGEPFKAYYCRTCTNRWDPYTITQADVERPTIEAFGRQWLVVNFMGRILPGDVGKRVHCRDGILQVENDEQRAARLARAAEPPKRSRGQGPDTGPTLTR